MENNYFMMSVKEFVIDITLVALSVAETYPKNKYPDVKEQRKSVQILERYYSQTRGMRNMEWCPFHMMSLLKNLINNSRRVVVEAKRKGGDLSGISKEITEGSRQRQVLFAARCLLALRENISPEVFEKMEEVYGEIKKIIEDITKTLISAEVKGLSIDAQEIFVDVPYPVQVKLHLDEWVVGQENLKERIALKVAHYMKNGDRSPLLIIGGTGCGKNYTIESLGKFPDIEKKMVIMSYDVSQLTANGFKGSDIEDIMKRFKMKCMAKKLPMNKGIIYLDEFDKIILPSYTSQGENVNAQIQFQLLSMIAGTETIEGVNCENILFILGGAFTALDQLEKERKEKRSIGFSAEVNTEGVLAKMNTTLRDNLIAIGAQREMLGRISEIVRMDTLNHENLKEILVNDKFGVLGKKKLEYRQEGVELQVEDAVIDRIVEKAVEENLGARSVTNIMNDLLSGYLYTCISNGCKSILFHKGMLENNVPPYYDEKYKEYA